MRTIKFRAWDAVSKKMWSPEFIYLEKQKPGIANANAKTGWVCDNPIMQFTDLLDKNGVEIYEGDIVKYTASVVPLVEEVYEVIWYQAGFGFKKPGESGCATYLQTSKLEVIGNIHEHRNLLTPQTT